MESNCRMCAPDDPDNHLRHEIPSEYTPLRNRGCHCGADCFEDD